MPTADASRRSGGATRAPSCTTSSWPRRPDAAASATRTATRVGGRSSTRRSPASSGTGLHGTTTDDIAAEAELSNGALYRYFDGKAAIIEAIAAERHDQERALLGAALGARRSATRGARLRGGVLRVARRPRRAAPTAGERPRVGGGAGRRTPGGGGRGGHRTRTRRRARDRDRGRPRARCRRTSTRLRSSR